MKRFVVDKLIVEDLKKDNAKMLNYDLTTIQIKTPTEITTYDKEGFFKHLLCHYENRFEKTKEKDCLNTIGVLKDLLNQMETHKKIKVKQIHNANFDENVKIVEFSCEGKLFYEIIDSSDLEELSTTDLISIAIKRERIDIKKCSPYLKEVMEDCRINEMGFYEEELSDEEKDKLVDEVCEIDHLDSYIEIDGDETIVAYAGAIQFFVF